MTSQNITLMSTVEENHEAHATAMCEFHGLATPTSLFISMCAKGQQPHLEKVAFQARGGILNTSLYPQMERPEENHSY